MAIIQSLIVLMLLLSFPLWRKNEDKSIKVMTNEPEKRDYSIKSALGMKGAPIALLAFFLYCAIESTLLNWGASFTVFSQGLTESEGAQIASFAYWGITIGRFLTGLINEKTGDRFMIALGLSITLIGGILLLFSPTFITIAVSIFLIGMGFAPIYPSMIHQTTRLFGAEGAAKIMGLEMASAYIGSSLTPFLFGLITRLTGQGILPVMVIIFTFLEILVAMAKRRLYDSRA